MLLRVVLSIDLLSRHLDTTLLHHDSAVVIYRPEIEELVSRIHSLPENLCELFPSAMEHLSFESLVHAVLCPLGVSVEVEIPIINPRYMNAVSVQFDHVEMIAAISVPILVSDDDEKDIR